MSAGPEDRSGVALPRKGAVRPRLGSYGEAEDEEQSEQLARIPDLGQALREPTAAVKRQVFESFDQHRFGCLRKLCFLRKKRDSRSSGLTTGSVDRCKPPFDGA